MQLLVKTRNTHDYSYQKNGHEVKLHPKILSNRYHMRNSVTYPIFEVYIKLH